VGIVKTPARRPFLRALAVIFLGVALTLAAGHLIDVLLRNDVPRFLPYAPLVRQVVRALVVLIVGLWVAGLLVRAVEERFARTRRDLYGLTLLVRIGVYVVLLAVLLSIFHVSLAGILAGSAVGGVVLGFAIHTFASNLLNGVFATANGVLNYGDVVAVNSWVWSLNTVGKIVEIRMLFSKMLTQDGAVVSIPNSVLLGSSVLVQYDRDQGAYLYPIDTAVNADVPAALVLEEARRSEALRDVEIFFLRSRDGLNHALRAWLRFHEIGELNQRIHEVNTALDAAYWTVKNAGVLYGSTAFARDEGRVPLPVALPPDVPSETLLARARARGLRVTLVAKNATANTFLLDCAAGDDLRTKLEEGNLVLEGLYRELKGAGTANA
jgi:small-conductance mechanosensitive channel